MISRVQDLASEHPILQKLRIDYDKFAKDVGVIVPSGNIESFQTIAQSAD